MILAEEVWNETQLMELLNINKNQLNRLIREEKLPMIKLGDAKVFLSESLLKWLREKEISK